MGRFWPHRRGNRQVCHAGQAVDEHGDDNNYEVHRAIWGNTIIYEPPQDMADVHILITGDRGCEYWLNIYIEDDDTTTTDPTDTTDPTTPDDDTDDDPFSGFDIPGFPLGITSFLSVFALVVVILINHRKL